MPLIEGFFPPHVDSPAGARPLSCDVVLAEARGLFPGAGLRHAALPVLGSKESYGVLLRHPQDCCGRMYPETRVRVSQYCGEIVHRMDASTFNPARSSVGCNRCTFHNGSAFGAAGTVLRFTGFLALFLYMTGIRQWLRVRRLPAAAAAQGV